MKTLAFIRIDSIVDLITNSSSELFVIENKMSKELLIELVNKALAGHSKINEWCIENRFVKDERFEEWELDDILSKFPESDREMLKEKYFSDPRYYGISFDRDWIYSEKNDGFDVRKVLSDLGFELIDTDY